MNHILPIASGKGGVGKTVFSVNLGLALSSLGKTVVMVDLDLGASNLHTVLGIRNNKPGVGNLVTKQAESVESLVVPTDFRRLYFVPGDNLVPGTANLPYFQKLKLFKQLDRLVADFVLLDLGSGSAYNTVDFFLLSGAGIVVTSPETTSILNAYSFLKTTLYRALFRAFPKDSVERSVVREFAVERVEGTDRGFAELEREMSATSQSGAEVVRSCIRSLFPRVVLNMCRTRSDAELGSRLRQICRKNLEMELQYIGFLPYEEIVAKSILKRTPACALSPGSPYCTSIAQIARTIAADPDPNRPSLHLDDDDLTALAQNSAVQG